MANAANDKQLASFGDMTGKTKYNGVNFLAGSGVTMIKAIGVTEYANLANKDASTLYLVVPDGTVPVIPGGGYEQQYFTVQAIGTGTLMMRTGLFAWAQGKSGNLQYRRNGGDWKFFSEDAVSTDTANETATIAINAGDIIEVRGGMSYSMPRTNITCTAQFNVYGNIQSLTHGLNCDTLLDMPEPMDFTAYSSTPTPFLYFFYNGNSPVTTLISAENLILPTTVTQDSYYRMFKGCTGLTKAPVLPATTLAEACYEQMFSGCTSLSYIKMMATDISASDCLLNWVSGVASSGTFVKNSAAAWSVTGTSGIPNGWTVQTASS